MRAPQTVQGIVDALYDEIEAGSLPSAIIELEHLRALAPERRLSSCMYAFDAIRLLFGERLPVARALSAGATRQVLAAFDTSLDMLRDFMQTAISEGDSYNAEFCEYVLRGLGEELLAAAGRSPGAWANEALPRIQAAARARLSEGKLRLLVANATAWGSLLHASQAASRLAGQQKKSAGA